MVILTPGVAIGPECAKINVTGIIGHVIIYIVACTILFDTVEITGTSGEADSMMRLSEKYDRALKADKKENKT